MSFKEIENENGDIEIWVSVPTGPASDDYELVDLIAVRKKGGDFIE